MIGKIIGISAALIMTINQLPQIIKGLKTRRLDDISMTMLACLLIGFYLWILYGYYLQDYIIIFANLVGMCFNLTLISLKKYYEFKGGN